jgi:ketosteroid isomerase-like protein
MKKTLALFATIASCLLFPFHSAADEAAVLAELDAYWAGVSRAVAEGDFQAYAESCHPEGVLVSGTSGKSQPLSEALARWKHEFEDTAAGRMKASVSFRFSQRLHDATTAHETGMFLYTATGPDGQEKPEYIEFQALLVKGDGKWRILMEYQKSKSTREAWEALGNASP